VPAVRVIPDPRRRRTLAWLVCAALAAAVLIPHVVSGSFYGDDWSLASSVRFAGYWSTVHLYLTIDHRPLLALYLPLLQWISSENAHAQLAWVGLMHAGMCACFYWLLRELGLERPHAGAIAGLVFLFPFADAGWLYVIGSVGTLAVTLWLIGVVVSLRALRSDGRDAWRLHALGLLLYVASVLLYELAVVAVLASIALYAGRAPRRAALRRWAVDVAAMVLVLLVQTRVIPLVGSHDVHPVTGLSAQLSHLKVMLRLNQGGGVLSSSLEPFAGASAWFVLVIAAAIWGWAYVKRRRLAASDPVRSELGRWLAISAAALAGLVAAWLVIVPANEFLYEPGYPGVSNRINVFAALWLCTLAYSLVMLLGTLVARGLELGVRWGQTLGLLLAAAIAVGYAERIVTDESHWDRATRLQHRDLSAIHAALPAPPVRSQILLFDTPELAAPGVPVFSSAVDLGGATQLLYGRGSVSATPILQTTPVDCTRRAAVLPGPLDHPVPYGRAFAVDALGRRGPNRIRSRVACELALLAYARQPTG
jgi:hypothetical protein